MPQRQNQTGWTINRSRSIKRHCYSQLSTAKCNCLGFKTIPVLNWNSRELRPCQGPLLSSCKQVAGYSQALPYSNTLQAAMTSWACCKPHPLCGRSLFSYKCPCSRCQKDSLVNWWANKSRYRKIPFWLLGMLSFPTIHRTGSRALWKKLFPDT